MCVQKRAAVDVCPEGGLRLQRGRVPHAGFAGASLEERSPLLQPEPPASLQAAQLSLLVFKVIALQIIFRNVKDWILNQDTLVALKKSKK